MKQLLRTAILLGAAGIGLAGCATYDRGYGYGGVEYGAGYGGYYEPGYWDYGPGYYGGWYDGFYYPGAGFYVYDRGGHRRHWSDAERAYWQTHHGEQAGGWRDHDWHGHDGNGSGWHGRTGAGAQTGQAVSATPVAPANRPAFRGGANGFHGFHGGFNGGARGFRGGRGHR